MHHDRLFLFGGLREITQESNETFRFNPASSMWEKLDVNREKLQFVRKSTLLDRVAGLRKKSSMDVEAPSQVRGVITPHQLPDRS